MATPITALQYNTVQSKIAKILGEGTGDYGYGQIVLSNPISEGDVFTFEMFDSLKTDILSARQHQIGRLIRPPISEVPANGLITAAQFIQYTSTSGLVESNRLVTPPSSQAVREVITSTTLIDPWNNVTTHTVELSFESGAAMRAYFNTGSTIEFSASRAGGGTTTKNTSWTNMLAAVGVVSFKRSATTSTKSAGTANGYTALMAQPSTPIKIFQRTVTDAFKPNYYSITAQLTESLGDEPPAGITFTIEFSDNSTAGLDINVTGTLTSTVRVYRAMGIFTTPDSTMLSFEAPSPTPTIDELQGGTALPTYSLIRTGATQIHEGDNVPASFYVSTFNVDDGTELYWTVSGYGISASDFEDIDSITDVPFTINTNSSLPLNFYAAADYSTEKLERFNLEIRTAPMSTSPVVANISASLQQITDDSRNLAPVAALASYRFISQTITSVKEGFNATFTIAATGITKPVEVTWKIVGILGEVTGTDFSGIASKLTGTFNITSTFTLNLLTLKDAFVEPDDAFQVEIYVMENNALTLKDTSATMSIVDTTVVVPEGSWSVSSNRITSIAEGNTQGVQFTVTTPTSVKNNTKLYWKAVLTSANGVLADADFKNTGGIGIGGTNSSYIFVTNNTATLTRYAANDTFTEGTESFAIEFYMDTSPASNAPFTSDRFVVSSPVVDVTEKDTYTISPPSTITEGNTTGMTYTVTTPYMEKGSLWWFIPTSPTITADDFNAMYGEIPIINSTGTFTIYAKDDGLIEGNETFNVVVRATSVATDAILISSLNSTVIETDVYTIDTQGVASIAEGGTRIDFAITTPKMSSGYVFWTLQSDSGVVDKDDFAEGKTSGQISITNNSGSFYLTALADGKTEGIESFHIVLRTGSITGPIKKISDIITITEVVKYNVNAVTTSITEGVTGTIFNITTPKVADATVLRWEAVAVTGALQTTDFIVTDYAQQATQATSGTVRVMNNKASFIMNARSDSTTEGAESFQVALFDADGNDLNSRSQIITLNEIINFSILTPVVNGSSVTSFDEGTKLALQVYTPKRDKNTPLYWKVVRYSGTITFDAASGAIPPNDFDGAWNGTVYVDGNNHAEIIIGISNDLYSDGVDVFRVEVREVSTSVLPDAVTLPITITDTSGTPAVIVPDAPKVLTITPKVNNAAATSVYEGGTITFEVATANILPARDIYYSIYGGAGLADNDIVGGLNSSVALHVNSSGIVNIPIVINTDVLSEAAELFMLQIILDESTNSPIAISKAVTITDALQYRVSPSKVSVLEGESIKLNFYTPPSAFNTNIRWNIDSVTVGSSSAVTAEDFDVTSASGTLYGTVLIDSIGYGSVTLTPVSNDATEGAEYFTVSLSTTAGAPIALGVPCPQIKIRENIDYSLSVLSTPMDEGGSVRTFTFTTPKMADSTFTYEVIQKSGTVTYSDFEETKTLTSGPIGNSFTTTNNTGTFHLQARSDNFVEGNNDSFVVMIYKNGNPVAITPECPQIYIHETGAYNISVIDNTSTLVPGGVVKYKITTPYYDDATKLYWEILPYQSSVIGVNDFVETKSANALTNYVTLYSNEGYFTLQAASAFNKGNTPFVIQLRTGSATGSIQTLGAACPVVTITPLQVYSISANGNNFAEGQTVRFTINTPVLSAGTTVYWKLVAETTGSPALTATDFYYSMNGATSAPLDATLSKYFTVGSTSVPLLLDIQFTKDSASEVAKSFHLEVSLTDGGALVELNAVNPVVTFTDEAGYVVSCQSTTILANEIATFKVIVPASSAITGLYWAVNASASYFTAASGVVPVPSHPNSTIEISIPVTAAPTLPDAANNSSFTISLRENNLQGLTIAVPNPPTVSLSKGFVLTGTTNLTAGDNGFTATVQTPIGTKLITWTIASSNILETELTIGKKSDTVVPDLVTGIATLPLISVVGRSATVAASAIKKDFILSIDDANGVNKTKSSNITVTYPEVKVVTTTPPTTTPPPTTIVIDPPKTVVFDPPSFGTGAVALAESKTVTIGVTTTSFKATDSITLELWSVSTSSTTNPKATLKTNFTQSITVPVGSDPVLLIGKINVVLTNNKGTVTLTSIANFKRIGSSKFYIKTGPSIVSPAQSADIVIAPTAGVSTPDTEEKAAIDMAALEASTSANKITDITVTNKTSNQMTQGKGGSVQFTVTPPVSTTITWAVNSISTGNVVKYITSPATAITNVTTGTIETNVTGEGYLDLAILDSESLAVEGTFSIKLTAPSNVAKSTDQITVVAPPKDTKTGTINNTTTFTKAGEFVIPKGVASIKFELKGGGGMGGGGGYGSAGASGKPGDKIAGLMNIPSTGGTLIIKVIPGGLGAAIVRGKNGTTPVAVQGILGRGGAGGDAMAIYWKGRPSLGKETPIAIVAGGGGGGAGGSSTITITPSSPTSVVSKSTIVAGQVAKKGGAGGGGAPNGTTSTTVPSVTSTAGGGGGQSYMDSAYTGAGVLIQRTTAAGGAGGAGGASMNNTAPTNDTGAAGEGPSLVITPLTSTAIIAPSIGDMWVEQGGYYAGIITDAGVDYHLIVSGRAHNTTDAGNQLAVGKAGNQSTTTSTSMTNGPQIFKEMLAENVSTPGKWPAAAAVNATWNTGTPWKGFKDWYIPSLTELWLAYWTFKPNATKNNPTYTHTGEYTYVATDETSSYFTKFPMTTYIPTVTTQPSMKTANPVNDAFSTKYWFTSSTTRIHTGTSYKTLLSPNNGLTIVYPMTTAHAIRAVRRIPV